VSSNGKEITDQSSEHSASEQSVPKRSCYLAGHGPCRGKITREHFISRSILEYRISGNTVEIAGLPWQPAETFQRIGSASLQSRILCEGHNSGLSHSDSVARHVFETVDRIDKNPSSVNGLMNFDGEAFSRWFLKVLCGYQASQRIEIPERWKSILAGERWPPFWGLCFPEHIGPIIASPSFSFEILKDPTDGTILACRFFFGGLVVVLRLITPTNVLNDAGIYHPYCVTFYVGPRNICLRFRWERGSIDLREARYVFTGLKTASGSFDYLGYKYSLKPSGS